MWPTAKIFNGRCDKIVRQKIEASYLYVRELWYVPFIVVGYNYQPLLKGFDIQYIYIQIETFYIQFHSPTTSQPPFEYEEAEKEW